MKTLLVDDSATMRKILINILATAGYEDVIQVSDGQQAVDAVIQQGDIELVLMDWNMPNMLGIDALKMIRAAGKTVPVIMVTTEAEKTRVLEALKAGANNYIIKPFKPETIIAKIQETMAKANG
jgi:two-component system chemotaxis response regulator CheY